MHYTPGYAYPLIVWLHGPGCDERQLLRIMPLVSMRNHVGVAPRGIAISTADATAAYGWPHDEQGLQCSRTADFRLDRDGPSPFQHSSPPGVSGRFRLRRHDGLPRGHEPSLQVRGRHLAGWGVAHRRRAALAVARGARNLAIFLASAGGSQVYGESQVCDDLRLLHIAGMSITLRLYPCGHEISPQMLTDLDAWIIERITSAKAKDERAAV